MCGQVKVKPGGVVQAAEHGGAEPLRDAGLSVSAAIESSEEIARARQLARSFLAEAQTRYGFDVCERARSMVPLVVSELVTNACKYAPGLCLLSLEVENGALRISVWDSSATLPSILEPDPSRVGQHGLEVVAAVCENLTVEREPMGKRVTAVIAVAEVQVAG
ncbi:ATP-binding protein [Streptomyces flavofungini]|uniref:ATP-binding protein n=1 Tax=Streptomyces flavofungini TaxID=68200 RepID=UPI0034DF9937